MHKDKGSEFQTKFNRIHNSQFQERLHKSNIDDTRQLKSENTRTYIHKVYTERTYTYTSNKVNTT